MGNLYSEPAPSRRYPNRHYLESIQQTEQVLERYSNRTNEPINLRRGLQMTKCMCERIEDPLVMTRELLADTIKFNRNNQRFDTLDEVIDLLNKHRQLWFTQSLSAVSVGYWRNKIQTLDLLLVEMEEMKCQNT